MFEIIAVTDRRLSPENFLDQIKAVASSGVEGIVLREKDLCIEEYEKLALEVSAICEAGGANFIVHQFVDAAERLRSRRIHLPLAVLEKEIDIKKKLSGIQIGVSIHSTEEGCRAAAQGADYLIAGHIFKTRSKEGAEGRGLFFLEEIAKGFSLPVYAIGGINAGNIRSVQDAGASGVCVLSPYMQSARPAALTFSLRSALQS
ncbi:thiamine phosphate synthase [Spirochaetia bacterium]|nr:thiamine phosphate synthase [Spirochaetia bacterium]